MQHVYLSYHQNQPMVVSDKEQTKEYGLCLQFGFTNWHTFFHDHWVITKGPVCHYALHCAFIGIHRSICNHSESQIIPFTVSNYLKKIVDMFSHTAHIIPHPSNLNILSHSLFFGETHTTFFFFCWHNYIITQHLNHIDIKSFVCHTKFDLNMCIHFCTKN